MVPHDWYAPVPPSPAVARANSLVPLALQTANHPADFPAPPRRRRRSRVRRFSGVLSDAVLRWRRRSSRRRGADEPSQPSGFLSSALAGSVRCWSRWRSRRGRRRRDRTGLRRPSDVVPVLGAVRRTPDDALDVHFFERIRRVGSPFGSWQLCRPLPALSPLYAPSEPPVQPTAIPPLSLPPS